MKRKYFYISFVLQNSLNMYTNYWIKNFCRLAWRSQSYYWRTMAIIEEELYEKRERRTFILPCYLFSNITSSSADNVYVLYLQWWYRARFRKKATRAARVREAEVVWWFHISPPFVSVFTKHLLTILECHAKTRLLCAC